MLVNIPEAVRNLLHAVGADLGSVLLCQLLPDGAPPPLFRAYVGTAVRLPEKPLLSYALEWAQLGGSALHAAGKHMLANAVGARVTWPSLPSLKEPWAAPAIAALGHDGDPQPFEQCVVVGSSPILLKHPPRERLFTQPKDREWLSPH